MSVTSVHSAIVGRLKTQTKLHVFEYAVPDEEDVPDGVYAICIPYGPYDTRVGRGIVGVTKDPYIGYELVIVAAPTPGALNSGYEKAILALRGFKPDDTTELRARPARGYQPVAGKFKPTMLNNQMLFEYVTNL